MRCKYCGGEQFIAHQICRMDVLVDGNGDFIDGVHKDLNLDIYDSESPYGPFQCCGCGAEYDALEDGEDSFSGPVEEWFWEQELDCPEDRLRELSKVLIDKLWQDEDDATMVSVILRSFGFDRNELTQLGVCPKEILDAFEDTLNLPEHRLRELSWGERDPLFCILYDSECGAGDWEIVSGEDAMYVRVHDLMSTFGLSKNDIIVFNMENQL